MKKVAFISGKGGTGKTTIAVSVAELEKQVIRVDCDVDAPNMYLYYNGEDTFKGEFCGSEIAVVNPKKCIQCGKCDSVCKFDAIKKGKVDVLKCEGCGACMLVCPENAISLKEEKSADMYITKIPDGLISRAKMKPGADGSGKLITQIRKNVEEFENNSEYIIIDGSPGIGCAVIASITGNDVAIIVTEPTKSGMNDFIRVSKLCKFFNIPAFVCINKYDINEDVVCEIEDYCNKNEIEIVGKIPYDETIIKSINELKPIVYYEESEANKAIREMWEKTKNILKSY